MMKKLFALILVLGVNFAFGQTKPAVSPAAGGAPAAAPAPMPEMRAGRGDNPDVVKTKGSVTINGKVINYTATTGYLQLKTEEGKPRANIFYVSYTKDNPGDINKRPVTYAFNGGPGSATVWLHMGVIGPKRIVMSDKGGVLQPPYSYTNNEYSWLDNSDLVFIDPVGTGFSRAINGVDKSEFQGYNEDIQSVGEFIRLWTVENKRWGSPKFLAGESYGTTRAAGLSNYLQSAFKMYTNGVILISAVLNFQTILFGIGNDLPYSLYVPSYAATAWYYKKLAPDLQAKDIKTLIAEAESFALNEYTPALMKGDKLAPAEFNAMVTKLSRYTGLSEKFVRQANLRIDLPYFNKELLRSEGLTVGRLDSRFTGRDYDDTGSSTDFDPSNTGTISGPYTAGVMSYFGKELNYNNNLVYYTLGGGVGRWNYSNVQNKYLNVAEYMRQAMAQNPYLKIWVLGGYYDFACPYFASLYVLRHMGLRPEQQANIKFTYYESGHMIYINMPSLMQMKKDADEFYPSALPNN
ncbi:S10 family peptidase [Mucilaginibacter polytrichastri]|nr:carboxypeptidase [Mucilaginibacter polytrichastri]SFS61656.1 Carboxypeptidase C (cathepsin A) [Mucilaginibacter polytrichastri]